MMNNSRLGRSRDHLQNAMGQTYARSKLFSPSIRNEVNDALSNAISPFLQNFNNDEKEEKPISVKPKLRTTTTPAMTIIIRSTTVTIKPITKAPILLSRISPRTEMNDEKRARIQ
ncbi:unnamed protein product, partial [Acanthocheilonema viteae]